MRAAPPHTDAGAPLEAMPDDAGHRVMDERPGAVTAAALTRLTARSTPSG
ncbi:hypothetical protein ACGF7W_00615 [Streptomyces sp. NPDC048219]